MTDPCRACNGEVSGELVLCRACQAPYHMSCLAELGACAACQCAKVPLAPAVEPGARRPTSSSMVAAAVGAAVAASLSTALVLLWFGKPAAVAPAVTAVTETRTCTVSRPPTARCRVSTRRNIPPPPSGSPAFLKMRIGPNGGDPNRSGFSLAIHEDGSVEFSGGGTDRMHPRPRPRDPAQNLGQLLCDIAAVAESATAAEESCKQARQDWNVSVALQKNGNSLVYQQTQPNGPDPAVVRRMLEHQVDSLMGITRALNDAAKKH